MDQIARSHGYIVKSVRAIGKGILTVDFDSEIVLQGDFDAAVIIFIFQQKTPRERSRRHIEVDDTHIGSAG